MWVNHAHKLFDLNKAYLAIYFNPHKFGNRGLSLSSFPILFGISKTNTTFIAFDICIPILPILF